MEPFAFLSSNRSVAESDKPLAIGFSAFLVTLLGESTLLLCFVLHADDPLCGVSCPFAYILQVTLTQVLFSYFVLVQMA